MQFNYDFIKTILKCIMQKYSHSIYISTVFQYLKFETCKT